MQELGTQLPEVGRQVRHIRQVYDRGRDKVKFISLVRFCALGKSHVPNEFYVYSVPSLLVRVTSIQN